MWCDSESTIHPFRCAAMRWLLLMGLPWTCPGWPGAGAPLGEVSSWDWTPRCPTGWWRLETEFVCCAPCRFTGRGKKILSTFATSGVRTYHHTLHFLNSWSGHKALRFNWISRLNYFEPHTVFRNNWALYSSATGDEASKDARDIERWSQITHFSLFIKWLNTVYSCCN